MAKLYKANPPERFLDRIELILKDAYKAPDQTRVSESNLDSEEERFTMVRSFRGMDKYRYLLYRFDFEPGNPLFPYPYFNLKDANNISLGVAKSCDYVLFVETDEDSFIILLELKKGKDDPKPQLYQMRYFIEFIQQRAKYAGIDIDAQIRMVGISDAVMKDRSKMGPKVRYDNGFAQLYDGQFLSFSELAK